MLTGGSSQVGSDVDHLKTNFQALREASAMLRDTCARNGLIAARARQAAAGTCADAKRLRGELFRAQLPRDARSGAVARRLVEEHLATHPAEEIAGAKTVVSALVNNAVVLGRGAIELRVSMRRGRLRIEVRDEGENAMVRAGMAETPHGLDIVDALALAWGASEGSTRVWAELGVSAPAAD